MDFCVQLKVCEGCGCLWYRVTSHNSVYCRGCEAKLKEFPSPFGRKQRGRPSRKPKLHSWAVVEAAGGAQ